MVPLKKGTKSQGDLCENLVKPLFLAQELLQNLQNPRFITKELFIEPNLLT